MAPVTGLGMWPLARNPSTDSSMYDMMTPGQPPGLQELIQLQEQVKLGSLSMDEALERFSDWQRVQKGVDSIQQVTHRRPLSITVVLHTYTKYTCTPAI